MMRRNAGIATARASRLQIAQRRRQFTLHGAAQAAGRQQNHVIGYVLDEVMVEADFAEFVDDDGCIARTPGRPISASAKWSFRAEKAGQEDDRGKVRIALSHRRPPARR